MTATQPLILDPNGKIVHLLRQKKSLDWYQDPQVVVGAMSGGPAGMQLFEHIWRKSCRDRIIARAEKGLPQVQSDLVLVLGDEFMDLSGAERDELYGGGGGSRDANDRGARQEQSGWTPRGGDDRPRWKREAPPPPPVPPEAMPSPAAAAAAPAAGPSLDPRDLEAWLDASVHTVLRSMKTPLLQNELTRQPLAYEATAIAWATIGLQRETIMLDDLPVALQRWVAADMLVRQQPERATPEQAERRAMVDALFTRVGMGQVKPVAASNEGDTVRSMWQRDRGESAPAAKPARAKRAAAGTAPAAPAAPAPSAPATPTAAPSAPPVTEGEGELPPEPEPGFLLDEYMIHEDLEPVGGDQVPSSGEDASVTTATPAPPAEPAINHEPESPTRVAPAPVETHVRVWSATEPEPTTGHLVTSGVDWVRLRDDESGKVVRIRDLHRVGGPAVEDLDGTGFDRFFISGVETPVTLPPTLRADPTFMVRWAPRWESAGRPVDAWDLLAATWYGDFDDTARATILAKLDASTHASDRIFADALRTGFGAPLDGPTEGM